MSWLAINFTLLCVPRTSEHNTDYLQAPLSEPCTCGTLKNVHLSLVFLDVISGTPALERMSSSQLYAVVYKELLSNALPGRPAKQAPRMYTSMLQGLENLVCNPSALSYFSTYGWWVVVQTWCTLRLSDHGGLRPGDIQVNVKTASTRHCVLRLRESWLITGWSLLKEAADFSRDFLLPSPSPGFHGCS